MKTPYDKLVICKVNKEWYGIVKSEYLTAGTVATSFWQPDQKKLPEGIESLVPGTLVLYLYEQAGQCCIAGGGFFIAWQHVTPLEAWQAYGVRNGSASYDEFLNKIEARGGSRHGMLNAIVMSDSFIFSNKELQAVPDEYWDKFKDDVCLLQLGDEGMQQEDGALGLYLKKIVSRARQQQISLIPTAWPGIHYFSSHRNTALSFAPFFARVTAAYDFTCAITGTKSRPALEAAHIQPFYDHKFQSAQNGILMRCDIHRMFSSGYLTAGYVNDHEVVVKVSRNCPESWADDYLEYDGVKLRLPQDRNLWPRRDYLEWHKTACFEHWLHVGGTRS